MTHSKRDSTTMTMSPAAFAVASDAFGQATAWITPGADLSGQRESIERGVNAALDAAGHGHEPIRVDEVVVQGRVHSFGMGPRPRA